MKQRRIQFRVWQLVIYVRYVTASLAKGDARATGKTDESIHCNSNKWIPKYRHSGRESNRSDCRLLSARNHKSAYFRGPISLALTELHISGTCGTCVYLRGVAQDSAKNSKVLFVTWKSKQMYFQPLYLYFFSSTFVPRIIFAPENCWNLFRYMRVEMRTRQRIRYFQPRKSLDKFKWSVPNLWKRKKINDM